MTRQSPVVTYLTKLLKDEGQPNTRFIAFISMLEEVASVSQEVARAIVAELVDQRGNLKMIASENFSSMAVQFAQGNLFTDKYAEGIPYRRFYAGCDNVDAVESLAVSLAKKLFGADHAYMQPHSGADANLIAYWAILSAKIQTTFMNNMGKTDPSELTEREWSELRSELGNQRLLGMSYYSGGHLTHGYRHNVSARMFEATSYDVDRQTGLLDYDRIREQAKKIRPLILLAGYSAYPRHINFRTFREIADEVGAVFMVDMAHFSGLVAGGVFTNDHDPVAHAHVVTSTTHKTLRGPRGGMVLCSEEFAEYVDKGCPMVLGGPLPHVISAKAVAFQEANTTKFKEYAHQIVANAAGLAEKLMERDVSVLTGGTDNHLILLDVTPFGITGRQAEAALRDAGITLNRNSLPFDANGPWYTSGLRLGTPALTTLGMTIQEMSEIADIVKLVLSSIQPETINRGHNVGKISKARYRLKGDVLKEARTRTSDLLNRFPVYPELDIEFLKEAFV